MHDIVIIIWHYRLSINQTLFSEGNIFQCSNLLKSLSIFMAWFTVLDAFSTIQPYLSSFAFRARHRIIDIHILQRTYSRYVKIKQSLYNVSPFRREEFISDLNLDTQVSNSNLHYTTFSVQAYTLNYYTYALFYDIIRFSAWLV